MANTAIASINDKEQFKDFLLTLLKEDNIFAQNVKKTLNVKPLKKGKKDTYQLTQKPETDMPFSEMPFWKLNPDFPTIDTSIYRMDLNILKQLQEVFKDAPLAEEIIKELTK